MVKHDGSIDFSINQKTSVQELIKVLDFSRQEKQPRPRIEPGSPVYKSWCAYHYTIEDS